MLNYSCNGQLRTLSYTFDNIRNVDDIAIRLINGSVADGLIRISINKTVSSLEYDVVNLMPADETDTFSNVKELAAVLEDLKTVTEKLTGYGVDLRYLPDELPAVFKEPVSGKYMFAFIPCSDIIDDQRKPGYQLIKTIIGKALSQSAITPETSQRMEAILEQEKDICGCLQKLTEILCDDYPECSELKKRVLPDYLIHSEKKVFDEAVEEAGPEKVAAEEAEPEKEAPELLIETEIAEDVTETEAAETEAAATEAAATETEVTEPETAVPETAETEVENDLTAMDEHPEEDEAWLANLRESIRKEILEESAAKRNAYLVRRRKDEIISLSKEVFVIGKLQTVCDYVIADNPAISRLHAIIRYNENTDEYVIIDCDTTNHTYLNGRRIQEEHAEILKDQMIIHMATEEFLFRR